MNYPKNVFAGFWIRFLAYIVDQIILTTFTFMLIIPVLLIAGISIPSGYFERLDSFGFTANVIQHAERDYSIAAFIFFLLLLGVIGLLIIVINWLYYALMESSNKQATFGKMIAGIIVTDMKGNKISFGRASGRFFGKILSGMLLNVGYILAAFTDKKQALHDILAGCLVLKKTELNLSRMQQDFNQNKNNINSPEIV